jgi:hypothetical protein
MLARRHLDAFLQAVRTGGPPSAAVLAAARERAVQRAREMVPLAAQVHSYLIAQRVISAAIAREADTDARSRDAALMLTAKTFDYNIAVTAAMAEAYLQVVQGELAELDSARRSLIDALLTSEPDQFPALARHAAGLGFDPDRELVTVVAVVVADGDEPLAGTRAGRPRRSPGAPGGRSAARSWSAVSEIWLRCSMPAAATPRGASSIAQARSCGGTT